MTRLLSCMLILFCTSLTLTRVISLATQDNITSIADGTFALKPLLVETELNHIQIVSDFIFHINNYMNNNFQNFSIELNEVLNVLKQLDPAIWDASFVALNLTYINYYNFFSVYNFRNYSNFASLGFSLNFVFADFLARLGGTNFIKLWICLNVDWGSLFTSMAAKNNPLSYAIVMNGRFAKSNIDCAQNLFQLQSLTDFLNMMSATVNGTVVQAFGQHIDPNVVRIIDAFQPDEENFQEALATLNFGSSLASMTIMNNIRAYLKRNVTFVTLIGPYELYSATNASTIDIFYAMEDYTTLQIVSLVDYQQFHVFLNGSSVKDNYTSIYLDQPILDRDFYMIADQFSALTFDDCLLPIVDQNSAVIFVYVQAAYQDQKMIVENKDHLSASMGDGTPLFCRAELFGFNIQNMTNATDITFKLIHPLGEINVLLENILNLLYLSGLLLPLTHLIEGVIGRSALIGPIYNMLISIEDTVKSTPFVAILSKANDNIINTIFIDFFRTPIIQQFIYQLGHTLNAALDIVTNDAVVSFVSNILDIILDNIALRMINQVVSPLFAQITNTVNGALVSVLGNAALTSLASQIKSMTDSQIANNSTRQQANQLTSVLTTGTSATLLAQSITYLRTLESLFGNIPVENVIQVFSTLNGLLAVVMAVTNGGNTEGVSGGVPSAGLGSLGNLGSLTSLGNFGSLSSLGSLTG